MLIKCSGEGCPHKDECVRAPLDPDKEVDKQMHFIRPPILNGNNKGKCPYFTDKLPEGN